MSRPTELSLEARIALMSREQQEEVLAGLDPQTLLWDWEYRGRPSQIAAARSVARITLLLAGRGYGKTLTGSEWVREKVRPGKPATRGFLCGRTAADVRDTIINGESGLLNSFPPSERPEWIASQRLVKFANGSTALCLSAKEPDQARGPQAHWALGDEWASWDFDDRPDVLDLWDNVQIATRLGSKPQIMLTTTPKRIKQVRELVAKARRGEGDILLITGSTYDNVALSPEYLEVLTGLYSGTRLEAQELYAEVLDEVEGALWTETLINDARTYDLPGRLPLRVVAVDPSTADVPRDECGIVVVGASNEPKAIHRTGWVLDDRSGLMTPSKWARAVVEAAHDYDAIVIAEANQGGAMVREMINSATGGADIKVRLVHAKDSKKLRAEPVAAVYDQRRVRHVGRFPQLEDQMTSWVPSEVAKSPDRIDALVHGLTALLLPSARGAVPGQTRVSNPARGKTLDLGRRSA